jgi:mono/diheme cytochrome c family protein
MTWPARSSTRRLGALVAVLAGAAALVLLAGCEFKRNRGDLVAGKKLFVQKCGSCHQLARAQSKGAVGPDLDAAFTQSLRSGLGRSSIRSVVDQQVLDPNRRGLMPNAETLKLSSQQVSDIAAYVAFAAARPGKDTGALATAVGTAQKPLATAQAGTLQIPADPNGQLLYVFKNAQAKPGMLTLQSKNGSSVPHDISVEGAGLNRQGPTVQNGGTSTLQVALKPGTYTFYCSVDAHRQAGMQGKLTVK